MYRAIVIGVSAGGLKALSKIIPVLPDNFPLTIAIVQHVMAGADNFLAEYLQTISKINVKEAEWGEKLERGTVYIAPPGYHLLIEKDETIGLSVDPRVNFAIPSIDVLFESAARTYKNDLVGVILTGANSDGSEGLKTVKEYGGFTIVQNPETAESPEMPNSAIRMTSVDRIIDLEDIGTFLKTIIKRG